MDATDRHMARIYDRIDADARLAFDCERCELNAATARLKAERDAALAWAALWKRAATINRYDRAWGDWHHLRAWATNLDEPALPRALRSALGICTT